MKFKHKHTYLGGSLLAGAALLGDLLWGLKEVATQGKGVEDSSELFNATKNICVQHARVSVPASLPNFSIIYILHV